MAMGHCVGWDIPFLFLPPPPPPPPSWMSKFLPTNLFVRTL